MQINKRMILSKQQMQGSNNHNIKTWGSACN